MSTSIARRRFLRLAIGVLATGAAYPLTAVAHADAMVTAYASHVIRRSTGAPPAEAIRQQADDESVFVKLLRMLPDGDGHLLEVYLNDFARAARLAGLQPPPHTANDVALREYMTGLRGTSITNSGLLSGVDEYQEQAIARRKYLAFGVGEVTHTALIWNPPVHFELVLGKFDPSATEAALNACGDCVMPPVRETHQGVPFYAWGDDFRQSIRDRFKPPAFDQLGRGGRIALQPNFAYRTLGTEEMHWAIEASQRTRASLADVTAYTAMASALESLGAYTLYLTNDTSAQTGFGEQMTGLITGEDADEATKNALDPAYLLRPYLAAALGAGRDEAGPYMTVGLLHPNPELAAENVARLPERIKNTASIRQNRPWRELWGEVEARAEGHYLFARIRRLSDDPLDWLVWWMRTDSLLYWG
jgi:hypothetical protein